MVKMNMVKEIRLSDDELDSEMEDWEEDFDDEDDDVDFNGYDDDDYENPDSEYEE